VKATDLISRLQHLVKQHGDLDVLLDTDCLGPHRIGEVDVDTDDTGIMIWAEAKE
jgi:hypothetical protein